MPRCRVRSGDPCAVLLARAANATCANVQTGHVKPSRILTGLECIAPGRGCAFESSLATWKPNREKVHPTLYTIAVVLLILWLLGLVTSYTLGGFIHILVVVAIVMILVNLITGRRAL